MKNFPTRRTIVVFLLLSLVSLNLAVAQSNVRISIKNESISVKEALQEVERQSSMSVAYNESKLNGDRKIKLDLTNESLDQALTTILAGTNHGYQFKDNYVMIVPQRNTATAGTITGRVVDTSGEPLIGATVMIPDTERGTITGYDGGFTISAAAGERIRVSYLGYADKEVRVTTASNYVIELNVDTAVELSELVVTALGIKREEKALSYNVQEVSSQELTTVRDANLMNTLAGKIAGVTINTSSSGVGGASKVVMRGAKSIDQSSNALYVIDGVPMYNIVTDEGTEFASRGSSEAIADINPEDIESLSVLTGAAAAALYGSHASNGAVIITTKKGIAGQTSVTVSQNTEFSSAFVLPKFQNSYGTGSMMTPDGSVTDKSWGRKLNDANYMGYRPGSDYLRTGVVASENISLSTGTERNQTYLSAGAVNSKGIIPNNKYNRYNFNFRNTTSFLDDKMTLDLGGSYIVQNDLNMTNQGKYSNPLVTSYLFPRGDDWNDIRMFERYNTERSINTQYWPQGINEFVGQNPYWINYRNLRENKRNRYMLNASLNYEILDWLSVIGRVRIDNSGNTYREKFYASSNTTLTEGSDNGLYGYQTVDEKQTYADVLVNINKTLAKDLTLHANVGASISDVAQKVFQMRGPIRKGGIPNKFHLVQLDYATSKYKDHSWKEQTQSLFASIELGYKGAYYLTFTGRNDWPSQLAGSKSSQKSFFYPSVGGSVVLSEVLNMPKQISYLKLRGSFASVGLPFSRFLAMPVYEWDESTQQYKNKAHYPMSNLKPERTNSWEVGVTMRFLKNFHLDASFYSTKTYNQTFDPQISVSSKYTTLYVQTGSVQNRGVELALGYQNQWGDFAWSSNYTFSANRNKILELVRNYVHPETGALINKDRLEVGGLSQAKFILKEGGTLGDLYSLSDLLRDDDGNIYIDQNGDVVTDNRVGDIKLGSVFPKANMAWRNNFNWRNFSAGFMFSARLGGIVYSATQATLDLYGVSAATAKARDRGGVIINGGDRISAEKWYSALGAKDGIPQYYTYSATNVRLQEVNIGYTIPRSVLGNIGEITISFVGRNLWMIYNKAPFDPETTATTGNYYQGIDNFMMPSLRNIGFNVVLKF